MNKRWQVIEKDSFGTDWHQVRYQAYAMQRFDTQEEAIDAAKRYLTDINCNNALTKDEKLSGAEAFMILKDDGCFMGVLDGEDWYLKYAKDTKDSSKVACCKGDKVKDAKYYMLEGKTEVDVREVPGMSRTS